MKTYIATPLPIAQYKEKIEKFLNCKMEIHEQNTQIGILNIQPTYNQLRNLEDVIDIEVTEVEDLSEWI